MIRLRRAAGLAITGLAGALVSLSCASAPPRQRAEAVTAESRPAAERDLEWERRSRRQVDEYLERADELASGGDLAGALDCIDCATALLLHRPPGYEAGPEYLEYLSEVLDRGQELEDRIEAPTEPMGDEETVPLEIADSSLLEIAVPPDGAGLPGEPVPSDLPLVLNPEVERFLRAFTTAGELQRRIEKGLERGGPYLRFIRERLSKAGLPQDLAYLPIIESGFSTTARSRAGAQGMWQFIASTARRYGLRVGTLLDERRDPYRATEAAVAHLADLHAEFGDWYLALAAYNSGAGNVRRAIRRVGSSDFWKIRRALPRETRNYVPAFIASVMVAKNPERYGFHPTPHPPLTFDEIQVPDALDLQVLAQTLQVPVETLRELNPAIRYDLTPAGRTTTVRVPEGLGGAAQERLASIPRSQWAPRFLHTVRRGESLYSIARRFGSTVSAIRQANHLRRSLIRPGQRLIVPRGLRHSGSRRSVRATGPTYVVRQGDTLWDIARSAGVSVHRLAAANGLSTRSTIRPGQRLTIPGSGSAGAESRRTSAGTGASYRVRRGDSLSTIARRFGVSVRALREANGIHGSTIRAGQRLTIPGGQHRSSPGRVGTTYRVRSGDTLFDIGRRFGVPVRELRRANGLRGNLIRPGQRLTIPSRSERG